MQDQEYQASVTEPQRDCWPEREARRINRFVKMLYKILQATESGGTCAQCIHWSSDGEALVITSPTEFLKILPKHFKARSFASFVRQLNMYDFHKVRGYKQVHVFRHPFFTRSHPENLKYVKRKPVKHNNDKLNDSGSKADSSLQRSKMVAKLFKYQKMLEERVQLNHDLTRITTELAVELQDIRTRCDAWIRQILILLITVVNCPDSPAINCIRESFKGVRPLNVGQIFQTCKESRESVFVTESNGAIEMRQILEVLNNTVQNFIGLQNSCRATLVEQEKASNSFKPEQGKYNNTGQSVHGDNFYITANSHQDTDEEKSEGQADDHSVRLLSPILLDCQPDIDSHNHTDARQSKTLINTSFDDFIEAVADSYSADGDESIAMASSLSYFG